MLRSDWICHAARVSLLSVALAGCASNAANMTSPSPDQPWKPNGNEGKFWSMQQPQTGDADTSGNASFAVPSDSARAEMSAPPEVSRGHTYTLPELIDLAQRNSPATRVAWEQARQAALAVGIAEASYLPALSASVVGGSQRTVNPLPVPIGDDTTFETTANGSTQIIALQWLLFDFGQRQALNDVAKQEAFAANVLFNGAHQRLIFEVGSAYYTYGASLRAREIAQAAYTNSADILDAAEARMANGVGTTIEVAQAKQQVAQSQLRQVEAQGQERDSYQALLAAVGVNIPLKVDAVSVARRPLPGPSTTKLDQMVQLALSRRADVAATYSQLLASKSAAKASNADYLPKVYMGATSAWGDGGFSTEGLPTIGQQGTGTGVLVGATMPLYDGGARKAQQRAAQARVEAAQAEFERVQTATVTEVVSARNRLQTALESYRAATALVDAATVTYDATLAAYRNGVGTITDASAADSGLLDARLAQVDAHASALIGALDLAFVAGALTSRNSVPR